MSNQKLMILIWPNQTKLKNGLAPLYLRISIDGQKVAFATKHYIDPIHWSKIQSRLKPTAPDATKLNSILDRARFIRRKAYTTVPGTNLHAMFVNLYIWCRFNYRLRFLK